MQNELTSIQNTINDLNSTDTERVEKARQYVLGLVAFSLEVRPNSAAEIILTASRSQEIHDAESRLT